MVAHANPEVNGDTPALGDESLSSPSGSRTALMAERPQTADSELVEAFEDKEQFDITNTPGLEPFRPEHIAGKLYNLTERISGRLANMSLVAKPFEIDQTHVLLIGMTREQMHAVLTAFKELDRNEAKSDFREALRALGGWKGFTREQRDSILERLNQAEGRAHESYYLPRMIAQDPQNASLLDSLVAACNTVTSYNLRYPSRAYESATTRIQQSQGDALNALTDALSEVSAAIRTGLPGLRQDSLINLYGDLEMARTLIAENDLSGTVYNFYSHVSRSNSNPALLAQAMGRTKALALSISGSPKEQLTARN